MVINETVHPQLQGTTGESSPVMGELSWVLLRTREKTHKRETSHHLPDSESGMPSHNGVSGVKT